MIELDDEPAILIWKRALDAPTASPAAARTQAASSSKAQLARIAAAQDALIRQLQNDKTNFKEFYRMQRTLNGVALRLDDAGLARVRKLSGVKRIRPLVRETPDLASSVPFIDGPTAWASLVAPGLTGENIRIGIIDSGIDYLHTDFGGPGSGYETNDPEVLEPGGGFPSAKVVGGTDLAGDAYTGDNTPVPDPDPMDGDGHGTHVAGIAAGFGVAPNGETYAGVLDPSISPSDVSIGPGVAPKALLYAIKVFGTRAVTTYLVPQAIDWATDPNQDGDFSDRLDVVNVSIGSPFDSPDSPNFPVAEAASLAGMVVVGSAGNSGEVFCIMGGVSMAPRAISVANSRDGGLEFATVDILYPPLVEDYPLIAQFPTFGPPVPSGGRAGNLVAAIPALADRLLDNADQIAGNIALVDRGSVNFTVKVRNCQAAGAAAVVVANNGPGLPFTMGGIDDLITIPSLMITKDGGALLRSLLGSGQVTLKLSDTTRPWGGVGDMLTETSSMGPSRMNLMIKPEIAAPGDSIFSAYYKTGSGGAAMGGTSMSAPHVAGAAALLRQLHPTWSVEEIKAALLNSATHDIYKGMDQSGARLSPIRVGAGRLDVHGAAQLEVLMMNANEPGLVGLSFGQIDADTSKVVDMNLRIVNKSENEIGGLLGLDMATDLPGADFSFPDGDYVDLDPGESEIVPVRLTIDPKQLRHERDPGVDETQAGKTRHHIAAETGWITLSIVDQLSARVPVYAAVRPTSTMRAASRALGIQAIKSVVPMLLAGQEVYTGEYPPRDVISLVAPLELLWTDPDDPDSAGAMNNADIRFVGVRRYDNEGEIDLVFSVVPYASWVTPSDITYRVCIDTNNDLTDDFKISNESNSISQDVHYTRVENVAAHTASPFHTINIYEAGEYDTNVFNSRAMLLRVPASALGMSAPLAPIHFRVEAESIDDGRIITDATDWIDYFPSQPALDFDDLIYVDQPGATIQVTADPEAPRFDLCQGVLLLHLHNSLGSQAEVLPVGRNAISDWRLYP